MPAGVTKYGSIGMVTYVEKDVNGKISFDNKKTAKTAVQIAFEKAQQKATDNSISEKAQNDAKKFSLKDTTNESDSQTKSEAFKEWFGDWENEPESASKVVNEDGTPKVVYRGTGNEFFVFDRKKQGENYRQGKGGFFFTSHKKTAENYAKLATDDGGTARVVEAYLSIKKPYTVYAYGDYVQAPMEKYDDHRGEYLNEADIAGCDGIIVEGELSTLYVVFDSEQIKSATDNIGLFDKKNHDIRFSLKNSSDSVNKRTFSYEEMISKLDMRITPLTAKVPKLSNGKVNRANLVAEAVNNAKKVGKQNGQGNVVIHVDDMDRDVILSKAALRHGIDRRVETQAPVLMHIGEVLRNSVEINELNLKKENASDSYILLGAAQGKEKRYVVFAVVNRFTNDIESVDVLYSMNIKEESAVSKTRASGNALQSLTDSTISISELLEIVKDKHPEILSAYVLAHYDLSRGNSELERGLKFSLKDTAELKAENKKLIEDNDNQRRYIRELESAVGLNKK